MTQGAPVVIQDDAFDAPTMRRMIDFMYHGEYDVGIAQKSAGGDDDDTDTLTKLDALSHLFCYAIAESYQIQELSSQALSNFSDCLRVVSPEDFAELLGVIAAHTEAKPVHVALRNIASDRQDELAACKRFVKTLGCGHIFEKPTHDQEAVSDLRAAKQLAVHGATLFRIANRTKSVTVVERNNLVRSYQESLQKIEQLRSQVDKDSSTLLLDEKAHNDATNALLASESAAKQTRDELLKAEEKASRTAQAMQKMKLELEVFRNAEHNNKHALEKHQKEAATLRLALQEARENSAAELNTMYVALDVSQDHALDEQRKAADMQRNIADEQMKTVAELEKTEAELSKTAIELAKVSKQRDRAETDQQGAARGFQRVKNEFFASQESLAKVKRESVELRDRLKEDVVEYTAFLKIKRERDGAIEEQKAATQKLEKANQEYVELRRRFNESVAESNMLRNRARTSEVERLRDQNSQAMVQHAAEVSLLKAEVNQARLNNFTLQRSIYDLQFLILSNAENRQQLLDYGVPNFVPQ